MLGAPTSSERFGSAKALLDYGFANYRITNLVNKDEIICDVPIVNGTLDYIKATAPEERNLLQNKSDTSEIEKRVYITPDITAPVNKGDVVGRMDFILNGKVKESIDLKAAEPVKKKGFGMIFRELLSEFV